MSHGKKPKQSAGNCNSPVKGIHLMAKPIGPRCNLNCEYCFYLEKDALFPEQEKSEMSEQVLDAYVRELANAGRDIPTGIIFAFQGGEPTLLGIDFFKKAVEFEKKYSKGRPYQNTIQTNGTLLDDDWCEFLAKNKFLVGLSLDGPEQVHDLYRKDKRGRGTFVEVLRALRLLQKHGVEYNILACVARETAKHPLEVYRFFKDQGVQFIQFLAIAEQAPDDSARRLGLRLGMPPSPGQAGSGQATPWSVEPEALGDFYIKIFDEWVRNDVGKMFVMNFEWALYNSMGGDGAVCYMSRQCGNSCIIEHNGDIYSCDHYVYPEYKLGNVLSRNLRELVESGKQRNFGAAKEKSLPRACRKCEVGTVCRGGCPRHRFIRAETGGPGLNYLCAGYKKFHRHSAKFMRAFQILIEHSLPCELIMQAIDRPLVIPASQTPNHQPLAIWIK